MNRETRAAQIWPILTYAASLRTTLTYKRLGELVGAIARNLGDWMEPIQSYCLIHKLPPLTVLVVRGSNGLPGDGFTAMSNVAQGQADVFRFDWTKVRVPTPEDLAKAVAERPSNGVSEGRDVPPE